MAIYLVSTEHLENSVWFRDKEDFIAAMNAIALLQFTHNIKILAFILMSNHVHFVLECSWEEVERFVNDFKRHYSRYMNKKYGIKELLRRNSLDVRLLNENDESVERAIAYVHMNCVAANICLHPTLYPWCSGRCFFSEKPLKGIPASSVRKRKLYRILRSRVLLPNSYIIGDEGYVLPESYISVKRVESFFRTPKRMNYFLNSSSKSKVKLEKEPEVPAFRDQIVISGIEDMCGSLFRKHSIKDLNDTELAELLRQLRFRFAANIQQLARVTGLSYEDVVKKLDDM